MVIDLTDALCVNIRRVFASTFYNSEDHKSLQTKTYDEVDM